MLELQCRAWLKSQKKMVSVVSINFVTGFITYIDEGALATPPPDDVVLMQYTGFKDKNKVKIFEGDIVINSDLGIDGYKDRDLSDNIVPDIRFCNEWLSSCETKVIGNIYKNPELYEDKKKK